MKDQKQETREVIERLLAGKDANGTSPTDCGPYAEAVEALVEADPSDRETVLEALCQADDALANLLGEGGGEAQSFHLTDLGNAERLIARHGHNLRYCYPRRKWFVWDGTRWKIDENGEVMRYGKKTVRSIRHAAADADTKEERKRLWKHAKSSESKTRLRAMEELARSEEGVPAQPGALDADNWLLNTESGTVDLRRGKLFGHDRGDLITKKAPVSYDPEAECLRWLQFLDEVFAGDQELIDYVQRALGYSMTGSTEEQKIFIPHGSGANGKGTFINTVKHILGDYAQATRPGLLMRRNSSGGPSEGEAALRGARFVSTSETGSRQKFSEATVKRLTGSDTVRARFLRENEIEFEPTHKIWLATNHKPVIEDTDHAIWRRIQLIPFNVTFSEEEQDEQLEEKLKEEAPGILRWMVEGCRKWQKHGLDPAQSVREATSQYRSEMDVIGAFLDEECVENSNATVQASTLYQAYENWCDRKGEKPEKQRGFGMRMTERGFERERKRDGYHYLGLGIRSNRQEYADS
jgi:putative DNA primase/helicase